MSCKTYGKFVTSLYLWSSNNSLKVLPSSTRLLLVTIENFRIQPFKSYRIVSMPDSGCGTPCTKLLLPLWSRGPPKSPAMDYEQPTVRTPTVQMTTMSQTTATALPHPPLVNANVRLVHKDVVLARIRLTMISRASRFYYHLRFHIQFSVNLL